MAQAGLIGGVRHSPVQQASSTSDDVIPIERGAGVIFVGLNMKMAQDAVICLRIGSESLSEISLPWASVESRIRSLEKTCKCRSQLDQGAILLGSEVVLDQFLALNDAVNRFGSSGVADESAVRMPPFPDREGMVIRVVPLDSRAYHWSSGVLSW